MENRSPLVHIITDIWVVIKYVYMFWHSIHEVIVSIRMQSVIDDFGMMISVSVNLVFFYRILAVYALWKVPDLVPAFMLKGGEVSRFVIGGADLMFPGIHFPPEGLPSFSAGEPWAVKVPGNPAPIAVSCVL